MTKLGIPLRLRPLYPFGKADVGTSRIDAFTPPSGMRGA